MTESALTAKELANKLDHDGIYIHYGIIQGATSNDTDCQVIIGDLFYGKHQFKDAMDWYRFAAEKNDAKGQYKMGKMYQKGGGVAIDYKMAMDWYLKAAAQNNSKATKAIGGLFENGLGVPVDNARANEWYNKGRRTSWFKKR